MAYGNTILKRLQSLKIPKEVSEIAQKHERDFEELQREQLNKGQNRLGNPLPKYTDDVGTYFKSIESAQKYARWKQRVNPNNKKPADVADFKINGFYHRNIIAEVRGMNLTTSNRVPFAGSIDAKTNNTALGLNKESAQIAFEVFVRMELIQVIRDKTGIK